MESANKELASVPGMVAVNAESGTVELAHPRKRVFIAMGHPTWTPLLSDVEGQSPVAEKTVITPGGKLRVYKGSAVGQHAA